MFRLEKRFSFEASHQLMNHDGKCRRLHGHSWQGVAILLGLDVEGTGPKKGMLVDFGDIGAVIEEMVEAHLDHWHLNDSLITDSPTSEMVAKWCFDYLYPKLPMLAAIRIEETCSSAAEYWAPIYKVER